ncbi:hypothetical protein ACGF5F_13360 [Streptomyces sp. NPDC047821]|uniref:hypothetical protein n=1 Tax=unclassified Streptomyces TaxID=2593676 RepID=UPI0036422058
MSGYVDVMERLTPLWDTAVFPPRYVIWDAGERDPVVFDREYNVPVDVEPEVLAEVLRRMREAGVPKSAAYPGRPCA